MFLQKLIIVFVMFNKINNSFSYSYCKNNWGRKLSVLFKKKHQSNIDYDYNFEEQNNNIINNKYSPKSINQEIYMKHLMDLNVQIILGVGPAGSGKTMLACYSAIQLLKKGCIKQIIITRPLVSVDDENIGFLPGNLNTKMVPWTQPIMDIFLNFYTNNEINQMISKKIIEISPLAYMRGRTFEYSFIIADEMQNSSPNQMLMMNTRIGNNSKLVITGDLKQTDKKELNGLVDFIIKYKNYQKQYQLNDSFVDNIQIVELNKQDIIRSAIVNKIIDIYDSENNNNTTNNNKLHHSLLFSPSSQLIRFNEIINSNETIIIDKNLNLNSNNDAALIPKNQFKHF
jgi:phosphate starvation-inducible PhoH-like protein